MKPSITFLSWLDTRINSKNHELVHYSRSLEMNQQQTYKESSCHHGWMRDPLVYVVTPLNGRTDRLLQMNRLSLRNNRSKFKTSGRLLIVLEESMGYTSINQEKPKNHNQCPERFSGITSRYPSVPKSIQLHVDIFRFPLSNQGIFYRFL